MTRLWKRVVYSVTMRQRMFMVRWRIRLYQRVFRRYTRRGRLKR